MCLHVPPSCTSAKLRVRHANEEERIQRQHRLCKRRVARAVMIPCITSDLRPACRLEWYNYADDALLAIALVVPLPSCARSNLTRAAYLRKYGRQRRAASLWLTETQEDGGVAERRLERCEAYGRRTNHRVNCTTQPGASPQLHCGLQKLD